MERIVVLTYQEAILANGVMVVDPDPPCIEWGGYVNNSGYGPHRELWIKVNGSIDTDLELCHTCNNRRCVSFEHMYVGTRSDNRRDSLRAGTHNTQILTPDLVKEVRARYVRTSHKRSNRRELEEEYGLRPGCLKPVLRGQYWKDV